MALAASAGSGVRPSVGLRWRAEVVFLPAWWRAAEGAVPARGALVNGARAPVGCWPGRAGGKGKEGEEKKKRREKEKEGWKKKKEKGRGEREEKGKEKGRKNREKDFWKKSGKLLGKIGKGFAGFFPVSRASAHFPGRR
jgi:hypothetical protein